MITNRSLANRVWIDLSSPTKEEVDSLLLTQDLSPITAKDMLTPTPVQCAKLDGETIYTVLHIPSFKHAHTDSEIQEVDFLISKNNLITARYDSIDALHYFAKRVEVDEILNKSENGHLFFEMLKEIYKGMADELSYIGDWMKEIEKNIFAGREKEMVLAISNVGRDLLNFKSTIDPHGSVFEFLRDNGSEKLGPAFGRQASEMLGEWKRMLRVLENQMNLMIELRETNNSLLSTKQNEIMKQLAVLGSILLPLTLVGQVFGLSVQSFPLKDHPFGFWIILAIMGTVLLISLAFVKVKKWM